jgi:nitrite reductase/ring-hydroxylating ferredoxin subunit
VTLDVCAADALERGQMVRVDAGPTPVVVIRTGDGGLYALADRCIHQGGPLSRGRLLTAVTGERPGEYRDAGTTVLKCPWHGFEFDVASGCALFDGRRRVRRFAVREDAGRVVLEVGEVLPAE